MVAHMLLPTKFKPMFFQTSDLCIARLQFRSTVSDKIDLVCQVMYNFCIICPFKVLKVRDFYNCSYFVQM